nr:MULTISPECIES: sigma-70 family RNA polymerase sigma factor [unclassified Nannocystis]
MAREGDPRAGRLIFDRYQAIVNRRVRRLLGPDTDLDDLVQNVFLAVFKGLESVKDSNNLAGWILGVTNHTIRRELRYRSIRWLWWRREPELPDLEDGTTPSPEAHERARRLYAVLDQLPQLERLALTLKKFEGCTTREIADACGYSESKAKRDLKTAEERLARLVSRDPVLAEYLRSLEERRTG